MKVLLTGAAGKLGSKTLEWLVQRGLDVRATDQWTREKLAVGLCIENLLEKEACYRLVDGCDAVVHLANHPGIGHRSPQLIFNENTCMNANIFQAAVDVGVKKIVFASSVQTMTGRRTWTDGDTGPSSLAYLPMDGELPQHVGNLYAASKATSELLLRYYAEYTSMSCVAVRFPALVDPGHWAQHRQWYMRPHRETNVDEAFSYLTQSDAARCIGAILDSDLPGYRCYFPASPHPRINRSVQEIIQTYFPNVPLKRPLTEMHSLVDCSRIERETGWTPQEHLPTD